MDEQNFRRIASWEEFHQKRYPNFLNIMRSGVHWKSSHEVSRVLLKIKKEGMIKIFEGQTKIWNGYNLFNYSTKVSWYRHSLTCLIIQLKCPDTDIVWAFWVIPWSYVLNFLEGFGDKFAESKGLNSFIQFDSICSRIFTGKVRKFLIGCRCSFFLKISLQIKVINCSRHLFYWNILEW